MITINKYKPDQKNNWDTFIRNSKIDTFLFFRDYMDYHSDRFTDSSFLIFKKEKLEAVLPGNIKEKIFYSHQGLTYGGIVCSNQFKMLDVLEAFRLINIQLKENDIKEVIYKPTPFIYHLLPSQEDIYALFQLGAAKVGCGLSSTIFQNSRIAFSPNRKYGSNKARRLGVLIKETTNFELFWCLLENNLISKYGSKPVHSVAEMNHLKSKHPDNIKLFVATLDDSIIGGTVLFVMNNIVHVQYISANDAGKETGALDLLFSELINNVYRSKSYFDFGVSTEKMGHHLNEGLLFQKETFGGRGVVYETYKYNL
jgi:hypothetical protein